MLVAPSWLAPLLLLRTAGWLPSDGQVSPGRSCPPARSDLPWPLPPSPECRQRAARGGPPSILLLGFFLPSLCPGGGGSQVSWGTQVPAPPPATSSLQVHPRGGGGGRRGLGSGSCFPLALDFCIRTLLRPVHQHPCPALLLAPLHAILCAGPQGEDRVPASLIGGHGGREMVPGLRAEPCFSQDTRSLPFSSLVLAVKFPL